MKIRALLILSLCVVMSAAAQPARRSIEITVKDAAGAVRTLTIGIDPRVIQAEVPLPPSPPEPLFDARLLDPQGRKRYKYDGAALDIRRFISISQVDTFYVRVQTGNWPVILSWETSARYWSDSLVARRSSAPLPIISRGGRESITLRDATERSFLIIIHRPRM